MMQKENGMVMRTISEQPIGQADAFYVTEAVFTSFPVHRA
jgi:hypothetical protein